jgi:hypothetical protein
MSLVAALLIGSSAFAIENTKVSGDANVFYHTTDANNGDLLDAATSAADIGLNLNATTDLVKNDTVAISAGAGLTVLTTLGLENNLVGNVWGSAHTATSQTGAEFHNEAPINGAKVDNVWWVNEAWVAATAGKTTAKVGRMALDTPLVFTETWSIEKNTFEAAVLINQDIPDTTLVGAYIGNGNGTPDQAVAISGVGRAGLAVGGVVNTNGEFTTFGGNGAYAIGAINNSFKPLTLQAWYYDVTRAAEAYWLQADLACEKIPGLMAGAQYSAIDSANAAVKDGDIYAVMLGFEMKDTFTAKVAYSQTNADTGAGANVATASGQSKVYTEAFWGGNFGKVTQADTQAYKVSVTSPANGIADLTASYTNADQNSNTNNGNDMSELALAASKTFGPLDATVAYIYSDVEDNNAATENTSNAVQVYLTVNF